MKLSLTLNKFTAWMILLVLVGPVLDLLTGYYLNFVGSLGSITPGILYRGVILTPVLLYFAFRTRYATRLFLIYFLLIGLLLGTGMRFTLGYSDSLVNLTERFLKIIMPISGYLALLYLAQGHDKAHVDRVAWWAGTLYGFMVVLSLIVIGVLGVGVNTYSWQSSFATKGLFYSQNAVSISMVMSLPLAIVYVYRYVHVVNRLWVMITMQVLWMLGAFLLSMRAALLGVAFVIVIFNLFFLFSRKYNRSVVIKLFQGVAFVAIAVVGYVGIRLWLAQDVAFTLRRFNELRQGAFRFRVAEGRATIFEYTPLEHLFGTGVRSFPLTENNLVDVYGRYGLATLVPLLLFFAIFYFPLLWRFLRKREITSFALLLSLSFALLHASLAGHVFVSAQINNLLMLVLFLIHQELGVSRQTAVAPAPARTTPLPAGAD